MNFKYIVRDNEGEVDKILIPKIVGHAALGFVALILFFGSWFTVGAGARGVVTRFSSVSRVVSPGLHFKLPIIEEVIGIDVQTLKEQVDATAASKDLQNVSTVVALNYNINPDQVGILFVEIGEDYKARVVDPAIQEAIKASTAKYTAEELITKREQLRIDILALVKEKLSPRHIQPTDISIVNFKFSDLFEQAIEGKVTAEQNALAAKNKKDQVQYEADQRVIQSKGEAEAIKIQAQAITQQGGDDYVKLQWIKQWNGQLPITMLGSATPLININQ